MTEQLAFEGPGELIPGLKRDEKGEVLVRWVRLERTTKGIEVVAPDDVHVVLTDGLTNAVTLQWE